MFNQEYKPNVEVGTLEKAEGGINPSKVEEKIIHAKELKDRIKEMYGNEEIPREAQDFLIKLDQIIVGYSNKN